MHRSIHPWFFLRGYRKLAYLRETRKILFPNHHFWIFLNILSDFQGEIDVPSRKLTYPTMGKGKSSTHKCRLGWDMWSFPGGYTWPVTLAGDYRCIPSPWGVRRLTTYGGASRWLKFQLPGDMFHQFSMEDGCSEHPSYSDSELPKQCVELRVVLIFGEAFEISRNKLQMILTGSRL